MQHVDGSVRALLTLGEDGKNTGKQRKGGQQSRQFWTNDGSNTGYEQNETRAYQNTSGDIPLIERGRRDLLRLLFGHEPNAKGNSDEYQNKKRDQRYDQSLQCGGEQCKDGQAAQCCHAPVKFCGEPGMDETERDQRKSAAQRSTDGVCGKGNIMADGEEENDRA